MNFEEAEQFRAHFPKGKMTWFDKFGKYTGEGMLIVVLLWIVCAYFGVYFTRVEDGM